MNEKSKGSIYSLAKMAKERLKSNNYSRLPQKTINNATSIANYISTHKVPAKKIQPTEHKQSFDETFYQKVCELIESGNTQNPVQQLMDKNFFRSLDTEGKQFYISTLNQKYRIMKMRYIKEHPISMFV